MNLRALSTALLLTTLVAGCGGGGGSSGAAPPKEAELASAAPGAGSPATCGFAHVDVTVVRVQVRGAAGWTDLALASPRRIDLAAPDTGILRALGLAPLGTGHYTGLRLVLAPNGAGAVDPFPNAIQEVGQAERPLSTPGAQDSGLMLHANFDVGAGQKADLLLQGCLPVVQTGSGAFLLRPSMAAQPRIEPVQATGEFRVNTTTPISAASPQTAALQGGGFVVLWERVQADVTHLFFQVYDQAAAPIGEERQIQTPAAGGREINPAISALADGGFAVSWTLVTDGGATGNVELQRFSANGAAVAAAVQVNSNASTWQDFSGVAGLADGGYVVTWERWNQLGRSEIWMRRFTGSGAAAGDESRVNTESPWPQSDARPIGLADGGFVVTWIGADTVTVPGGNTTGVFLQRFDSSGTPVGGAFLVNTTTAGAQAYNAAARLSGGGFVVTWMGMAQPGGDGADVYAQLFAASGTPVGGEVRVNTTLVGDQTFPSVAALAGGGYVITWLSAGQDGGTSIQAQRFDASGAPVGPQMQVNTTTAGRQWDPSVSGLLDGGFVVTWREVYDGGMGLDNDILAQRFDADGNRL